MRDLISPIGSFLPRKQTRYWKENSTVHAEKDLQVNAQSPSKVKPHNRASSYPTREELPSCSPGLAKGSFERKDIVTAA